MKSDRATMTCCSYSRLGRRRTTLMVVVVVVLFTTCGTGVHNLKCRTSDHSRRQGEFVDIAEQCKNSTSDGDRWSSMVVGLDGDYYSPPFAGQNDRRDNNNNKRVNNNNYYYNRRNNNNREYNVHRQDFANNNRGGGYYDDHDTTSCEIHPHQQNSGNNSGRQKNRRPGNSYYSSADYDVAGQTNFNDRQSPTRRYRRNANNRREAVAAATSGNRLLGNNRFRNLTKTGGDQSKGSILDKMDACTIHCVFNQLEMLNSNSRPDKRSILNIMTNQIKDVELKEFVHDSIDECFDALELDSHTENKCDFSKNFLVCMENKAQKNCDDWDETGSTTRMSSNQDGGNGQQLQDKRRGS